MHWRQNMSTRSSLRGAAPDRALSLGDMPSDSILFSSAIHPALKRSQFAQACLDVAALLAGALLVSATAVGIAASIFILLFVKF